MLALRRAVLLAALLGGAAPQQSLGCSLAITLGGTLKLSADGSRLGSDEPGGAGATLTIVNLGLGSANLQISAPMLVAQPSGFNAGGAVLEMAYAGGGLLAGRSRGYAPQPASFSVPALLSVATILTVHNRINSSSGFAAGTYQTKTVVTCS